MMDDPARLDRIMEALPPRDREWLSQQIEEKKWMARKRRLDARDEALRDAARLLGEDRIVVASRRIAIDLRHALALPGYDPDTPYRSAILRARDLTGRRVGWNQMRKILLALQLRLFGMSESMGDHDSEVMDGARINRDDAGFLGFVSAGCEVTDPSAVYARAGGGFGGLVLGRLAGR